MQKRTRRGPAHKARRRFSALVQHVAERTTLPCETVEAVLDALATLDVDGAREDLLALLRPPRG